MICKLRIGKEAKSFYFNIIWYTKSWCVRQSNPLCLLWFLCPLFIFSDSESKVLRYIWKISTFLSKYFLSKCWHVAFAVIFHLLLRNQNKLLNWDSTWCHRNYPYLSFVLFKHHQAILDKNVLTRDWCVKVKPKIRNVLKSGDLIWQPVSCHENCHQFRSGWVLGNIKDGSVCYGGWLAGTDLLY